MKQLANKPLHIFLSLVFSIGLISTNTIGQDLTVKIGHTDIIKSEILDEEREILIHLPENYDHSNKLYPVLYRLDGSLILLNETVAAVNRLTYSKEITPEMIIVAIKNTRRDKDMWPVNTKYYPEPQKPGAESFLKFIGEELVPYIDSTYRTTGERVICGQSLSSVFVLYTFLEQPGLFDSFIAISGGFPACEAYFAQLTTVSLMQKEKFNGKKLFITNGLEDPLDPNGILHKQIIEFSSLLNSNLEDRISLRYLPYPDEGHVPFYSLYDALKFIY